MNEIVGFNGEYRFLSNFFPSPIDTGTMVFPTAEHLYQACKCVDPQQLETIQACPTPGQAKRLGRFVKLRSDWDQIKLGVMLEITRLKYAQNPNLGILLKATGNAELIEENNWGDRFWGTCQRQGKNHLGKILMQVRSELP